MICRYAKFPSSVCKSSLFLVFRKLSVPVLSSSLVKVMDTSWQLSPTWVHKRRLPPGTNYFKPHTTRE